MSIIDLAPYLIPNEPQVEAADFRDAMRHLAGAVSVITVGAEGERTGFTATSVSSLSVEPPTLLVSLNRGSSSWPALLKAGAFAVNILAKDQQDVADRFAGRGGIKGNDRYVGWDWSVLPSGSLGLNGALVTIDCELEEAIERHSHALLIGRVQSIVASGAREPLLYWHGAYRQLTQ